MADGLFSGLVLPKDGLATEGLVKESGWKRVGGRGWVERVSERKWSKVGSAAGLTAEKAAVERLVANGRTVNQRTVNQRTVNQSTVSQSTVSQSTVSQSTVNQNAVSKSQSEHPQSGPSQLARRGIKHATAPRQRL